MKLFIKQRVMTLSEKFTIKNEYGEDVYYVEGSLFRIPKEFIIYDTKRNVVATINSHLFKIMSHYDVKTETDSITIKQNFTMFRPSISIVNKNWTLQGDFLAHEYRLTQGNTPIMRISKHWFTWGDSYMLDIEDSTDADLCVSIVIIVDHIMKKAQQNN